MSDITLNKIAEIAAERERDRISYLREIENAKTQERERIINLLVSVFDKPWSVSSREELEAFIKGEK